MERIKYRKTLDVHKNGIQFVLQGFETADNLSRVIEISLMSSGDAIDFPLEQITAMMYVTTPSAKEPSINECTIKDNKVVYDVLPIVEEGITTMQLKLIETHPEGARSVLASPRFAVEVTKSDADDGSVQQTTTFTALEDATAKAKATYDERLLRVEFDDTCIFRAFYADGTVYETDAIKEGLLTGHTRLAKSYAVGDTGAREGEDIDNAKYYSNVAKSSAIEAREDGDDATELLTEVRKHGVYTSFGMDFETGELLYSSPSYKFKVNSESGELEADGRDYTFEEAIQAMVAEDLSEEVAENAMEIISSSLEGMSGITPYASDLSAVFEKPTLVHWDSDTAFTPYAATMTTADEGFAIVHGDFTNNHSIIAWGNGDKNDIFMHTVSNGNVIGWSKFLSNEGGTLTGSLGFDGGKGKVSANDEYSILEAKKDENNSRQIRVANPTTEGIPLSEAVKFSEIVDGVKTDFKLFGEHNLEALAGLMGNVQIETGTFTGIGIDALLAGQLPSIEFKNITPSIVIIISEKHKTLANANDWLVTEKGIFYFIKGQRYGFGRKEWENCYFTQTFDGKKLSWKSWFYTSPNATVEVNIIKEREDHFLANPNANYTYYGISIGGENT